MIAKCDFCNDINCPSLLLNRILWFVSKSSYVLFPILRKSDFTNYIYSVMNSKMSLNHRTLVRFFGIYYMVTAEITVNVVNVHLQSIIDQIANRLYTIIYIHPYI